MNGLFVVFEGIDGAGKSTLRDNVAHILTDEGLPVTSLNEPTQGQTGKRIREMLRGNTMPDVRVLVNLFIEDRELDLRENINPALRQGSVVLMDRYYYSNAAYQGAMGLNCGEIVQMNKAKNFREPDLVFLVDLDPTVSIQRIVGRSGSERDVFEKTDFLEKVRSNYLSLVDEKCTVLNGMLSKDELALQAAGKIRELYTI